MSSSTDHIRENIPPEVPSSSVPIARELGILFGFLFASLVIMAVYAVIWRAIERKEEDRDRLRKQKLIARGIHRGRGGLHEKMLDREVFMGRAELADHMDVNIDMAMGLDVGADIDRNEIGIAHGFGYGALDRASGSRPGSRNQSRTREGSRSQGRVGVGEIGQIRAQSPMRNFSRTREYWDDGVTFGNGNENGSAGGRSRVLSPSRLVSMSTS